MCERIFFYDIDNPPAPFYRVKKLCGIFTFFPFNKFSLKIAFFFDPTFRLSSSPALLYRDEASGLTSM